MRIEDQDPLVRRALFEGQGLFGSQRTAQSGQASQDQENAAGEFPHRFESILILHKNH